jgi:hypothetical protein
MDSTPTPPTAVPPPPPSEEHQPPTSITPAQVPTSAIQTPTQQEQPHATQKPDSEQDRRIVLSPTSSQTTTNILLAGTNDRQDRDPPRPHRGSGGGTGWVVIEAKVSFPISFAVFPFIQLDSVLGRSSSSELLFPTCVQAVYVRTRVHIHITPRSVIAHACGFLSPFSRPDST